jgi:biopolymer transport protein ExbB/TolQ
VSAHDIEQVIFDVAEALRVPVLILVLVALAAVLVELGGFLVELVRRRRRDFARLERAVASANDALGKKNEQAALAALRPVSWSPSMEHTVGQLLSEVGDDNRLAKQLADFDFGSLRRLERTRMLVRFGPAIGLMGTLIPLSPALSGLAAGNVQKLSDNLRVAFSVTVLGLLVGATAYGISLVRDRLYGQDLSDLEYIASTLRARPVPKQETFSRPAAAGDVALEEKET